jgi:hypothetical protein
MKEFFTRIKRAWELSKRIRIIKNGATGTDEVWFETTKEANREICASLYRIA